jgi:uncharacterized protein YndB with AHSA1/START domain
MNAVIAPAAVVVRRTIAAPAEDIFDAWLNPEALAVWMRPGTIKSTVAKVEPRVGGRYEIIMQGESERFPHTGVYRVIDRPRRLVFTWHSPATDEKESLVTVELLRLGGKTEVVVTHEQLAESARESHSRGWTSALEHLDEGCRKGLRDLP